jgi:hypothetical protein
MLWARNALQRYSCCPTDRLQVGRALIRRRQPFVHLSLVERSHE